MIVFNRLWKVMEDKGVSTYQLREKCGIDSKTIRRLKANENVETKTLSKLCEVLDCGLEDIAECKRLTPCGFSHGVFVILYGVCFQIKKRKASLIIGKPFFLVGFILSHLYLVAKVSLNKILGCALIFKLYTV